MPKNLKVPPILVNEYGDPKCLKTTTALAAMLIDDLDEPPLLVGVRANIEAVGMHSFGISRDEFYELFEVDDSIRDLQDIGDLIYEEIEEKVGRPIYFDDINHKIQKSNFQHDDDAPVSDKGNKDGFYASKATTRDAFDFFDDARNARVMIITSAHESKPKLDKARKGGPVCPTYGITQQFCSFFDINLRFYHDSKSIDPYQDVAMNGDINSAEWIAADRLERAWLNTPPSLRELFRSAGYTMPYPRQFAHVQTIRDATLEHLRGTSGEVNIETTMDWAESSQVEDFEGKHGFEQTRWGMLDGIAAYLFEERAKARLTSFRKKRSRRRSGQQNAAGRAPTPHK